jgi:hypothetical protein
MSSKTFRVSTETEEITFTLEYFIGHGDQRKPMKREFHCNPTIPVGLVLEFAAVGAGDDEAASGAKAMEIIARLYQAAIVEDEYPVFEALLNDPKSGIDINIYSEVAGWLAGEYTARPTGENSDNSSPAPSLGKGSTGGASVTPLTFSRPEPAEVIR